MYVYAISLYNGFHDTHLFISFIGCKAPLYISLILIVTGNNLSELEPYRCNCCQVMYAVNYTNECVLLIWGCISTKKTKHL